jgi:hypothetical protein
MTQYIRENRDGTRERVNEWTYASDRASPRFRHVHQLPNVVIYQA